MRIALFWVTTQRVVVILTQAAHFNEEFNKLFCNQMVLNLTHVIINTFTASYLNTQGLNNSCLKSSASNLVDLTFQSRALRSFSLNQLRNLSL